MKNVMIALLLSTGLSLVVAGCGKEGGSSGGAAAGGDSVGVAECDDYIKKYEGCIKKAGGPAAAAAETAFKAQRDSFKQSASTPEGKTALKGTCKTMLDSLATNPMCK